MKSKPIDRSIVTWTLCLALAAVSGGCSIGNQEDWKFSKSWDIRRAVGWKKGELAPPQVPSRIVSTWTETTLNRKGEAPQRGFGGRLLFFDDASEATIRVAGQLVVYAYDEAGREAHETQPTRRFVFPMDQFVRHESASKLGPSYSVWLPWDEVGGEQKNISLIARFEPQDGPLIVGEQTRHLLPGTRQLAAGETAPAVKLVDGIRLTQYSQESQVVLPAKTPPARTSTGKGSEVTSIALPRKSWQQRLGSTASSRRLSQREPNAMKPNVMNSATAKSTARLIGSDQ